MPFHLKDVDKFGEKSAVCVPRGEGAGQIGEILKEMHRQRWQGDFGIEYEPYSPDCYPGPSHNGPFRCSRDWPG